MENKDLNLLLKELNNNESIQKFIQENNLTTEYINKNLTSFLAYLSSEKKCLNCPGLSSCKQAQEGMKINLKYTYKVEPFYDECKFLIEELKNTNHLYTEGYDFDSLVNQKVFITKERANVLSLIKEFLDNYEKDEFVKGLYIQGKHGTGKTFLMAYIAKALADKGHDVLFMFYPDLVRKIKSLIQDNKLEQGITELKNVDVLMLDDFGAENSTAFIRDEILSPILQYRMNNNLPTFMTSNLEDEQLINHLADSNNGTDLVRASRIRERIRAMMNYVQLDGAVYR